MASTAQIVAMIKKRQAKLGRQVSKAERSIEGWKKEIGSLDAVASSLKGMGAREAPRGRRKAKRARRGTWKPGRPGRPPQWYLDQQKAKGKRTKRAVRKKASPKVLAGLAKARATLAAKRKASKSG